MNVPPPPGSSGTLVFRRGPATAGRDVPAADLRFRRTDTLRVDVPASEGVESATARLLDRTGRAMAVPVNGTVVVDADGLRWLTAELRLAPLAPGDYILELTSARTADRSLTAFRVVP